MLMEQSGRFLAVLVAVSTVLFGAGPALAQSASAGVFAQLPPGEQMIVRSLSSAQRVDPAAGVEPLTLDQIAALKKPGTGWGGVFRTLRAEGRLDARNLGQVVSGYARERRGAIGEITTAGNHVESVHPVHTPTSGSRPGREEPGEPTAGTTAAPGGAFGHGVAGGQLDRGIGGGHIGQGGGHGR